MQSISDTTEHANLEAEGLPCLYSNNCIEITQKSLENASNRLSASQKKSAFSLAENVRYMSNQHGLNNLGFLTLTFPSDVRSMEEAQKRFHSLYTNYLRDLFPDYIAVKEPTKRSVIHFHLLVNVGMDIRTDFPWDCLDKRDYSQVPKSLRSLWSDLRHNLKTYGFGRHELLPVKSNDDGIAYYVGKYISKSIDSRPPQFKGYRMVNYGGDSRNTTTRVTPVNQGSANWRYKMKLFVSDLNKYRKGEIPINEKNIGSVLGKRWAYYYREIILNYPDKPMENPHET
jgi:hypothetical protein